MAWYFWFPVLIFLVAIRAMTLVDTAVGFVLGTLVVLKTFRLCTSCASTAVVPGHSEAFPRFLILFFLCLTISSLLKEVSSSLGMGVSHSIC